MKFQNTNSKISMFIVLFNLFCGFISVIIYMMDALGEIKIYVVEMLSIRCDNISYFKCTFQHEQINQQDMPEGKYKSH